VFCPHGQQTGVAGDLAATELQLQAAVKSDPQIIVSGVTHWIPLSHWHVERRNHCFSRVWRKLHAKAKQLIWEMRGETFLG
jgi:hypothetical protein